MMNKINKNNKFEDNNKQKYSHRNIKLSYQSKVMIVFIT